MLYFISYACIEVRTTYRNLFSISALWVLGNQVQVIRLKLMARAFTCRTIPLIPMLIPLKKRLSYSVLSYTAHPVPSLLRYLMYILLNRYRF